MDLLNQLRETAPKEFRHWSIADKNAFILSNEGVRDIGFDQMTLQEQNTFLLRTRWLVTARPNQLPPPGNWWIWLLKAGRGFGKTRTAAEDIAFEAMRHPNWRIGVIAPTAADVRDTCFEGESGLLAVLGGDAPTNRHIIEKWNRSMGELVLANGTMLKGYPGDEPDRLRGPQWHRAWVDELAAMQYQDEAWSNIEMACRLGDSPRIIVTTTPRPTQLIRDLIARSKPPALKEFVGTAEPDYGPKVPGHARSISSRSNILDAGPV